MELSGGYLTIQAVRSHTKDDQHQNGRYLRRETFSGSCARSFYVGEGLRKEDIHAKFEDGILRIEPACTAADTQAAGKPQFDQYCIDPALLRRKNSCARKDFSSGSFFVPACGAGLHGVKRLCYTER